MLLLQMLNQIEELCEQAQQSISQIVPVSIPQPKRWEEMQLVFRSDIERIIATVNKLGDVSGVSKLDTWKELKPEITNGYLLISLKMFQAMEYDLNLIMSATLDEAALEAGMGAALTANSKPLLAGLEVAT